MFQRSNRIYLVIILLSLIFWSYLGVTSQMSLGGDAICYQDLGERMYTEGLITYLKKGPDREPVYSYMIAAAMALAEKTDFHYQKMLAAIQICFLLISQLLLLKILLLLDIRKDIVAGVILYFGFSPAIVNSGLSLYSEISSYPFILGFVLLTFIYIQKIRSGDIIALFVSSTLLGLCAGVTVLAKALFEYIFLLFLVPVLCLSVLLYIRKKKTASLKVIISVILLFSSAYVFISGYKHLNKKYNGQYTITDRGPHILYTRAVLRTEPLTRKRFLIALSSVPGENVCRKLFGDECNDWLHEFSSIGSGKATELKKQGTSLPESNKMLVSLSLKRILANPPQYMLFMIFEITKMFFWESTQIGFVTYPQWVTQLYNFSLFKNTLRLLLFCISVFGFAFTAKFLIINRRDISLGETNPPQTIYVFFVWWIIFTFVGLYSFFITVTRYALPIAPLYLVCIAFSAQKIFVKKGNEK